jgi:hypothetical protein
VRLVTKSKSFEAYKLGYWGSSVITVIMVRVRQPGIHGSITEKGDQIFHYARILQHNVKKDGQCRYKRNNEACSCDHCCCGEAISITYSECVFVALVIHHAVRMSRII